MRKLRLAAALLAAVAVVGGCASTGGSGGDSSDRNVITAEQLAGNEHMNAYEAIQRLRPVWLRANRGVDSFGSVQAMRGPRVYLDGSPYGGLGDLKSLSVKNIEEIRFLDKRQATLRFGVNHAEGAILVTTR